MSATVGGKISGRVRVLGKRGGKSRGRKPPGPAKAARATKAVTYKVDPNAEATRVVVAVSIPPTMLARIDKWAKACQMSRSAFLVAAAAHFSAKVFP